ncbi:hypothetical protein ACOME3_002175 [Neoechinorhynchus agilis]
MAKLLGSILVAGVSVATTAAVISQPRSESNKIWDWNWDCRESNHGNGTRSIYLIRHGQYDMRPEDHREHVLTSLGRQQAQSTAYRLLDLRIRFDRLVHSALIRARETASIINAVLHIDNVEEDCLLNEDLPCAAEPSRSKRLRAASDSDQLDEAFRKHIHRANTGQDADTHEVYVFHANAIRYFVCRALQLPTNAWLRFSLNDW